MRSDVTAFTRFASVRYQIVNLEFKLMEIHLMFMFCSVLCVITVIGLC